MTNISNDSFFQDAHSTPEMATRLGQAEQRVIADAKAMFGVSLKPDDVRAMPSLRIHVYSGIEIDDDPLTYARELQLIPAVAKGREKAERAAAIRAGDLSSLEGMSPAYKMAEARRLGLTQRPEKAKPSAELERLALRAAASCESPQAKINAFRTVIEGGEL